MVPVGLIPVLTYSPCDDHFLIGPQKMPEYSDHSTFSLPDWCKRFTIGDVKNECVIWNESFRTIDAPALLSRIKAFLSDERKAERFVELCDPRENMSNDETFWNIEKMCTDGLYAAVDWTAIRACPEVFAYHFDAPSPFYNE